MNCVPDASYALLNAYVVTFLTDSNCCHTLAVQIEYD
ncbi:hypothetical protein X975_08457, partial [Stegodyphus mimosarum]